MAELGEDISFAEAARLWLRIGCLSFGGPAGQIALLHRELVETRGLLSDEEYLRALNFCMLLPGPEAMQLATYMGWRLHGVKGGLVAGISFVLPGALLVLLLAGIYANSGNILVVSALFLGLKAAVLAIVLQAFWRLSHKALLSRADWLIAFGAFIGLFVFNLAFPLVIAAAAAVGFCRKRQTEQPPATPVSSLKNNTLATAFTWLILWFAPLGALWIATGGDHILLDIGLFFSKLAVVTFGGAYAVLSYMAQEAVESRNWLTAQQMIDGLALAETTPGPLILVTEFTGYMAGFRSSGLLGNPVMGLAAAGITLWVTFVPCFLWIFTAAPHIERLHRQPGLSAALAAITAAVVGVIANLALWFGFLVLFNKTSRLEAAPVSILLPDITSLNLPAAILALIAALALFGFKLGVPKTLALCAGCSLIWRLLSG